MFEIKQIFSLFLFINKVSLSDLIVNLKVTMSVDEYLAEFSQCTVITLCSACIQLRI
jgi:hypothetical protein